MKILGSDFDGTLNQGGISDGKITAIEKWRNAGHKFGIVSGRGKEFREDLMQQFPRLDFDFFASCNGGHITDRNGFVIYENKSKNVPLMGLITDLLAWGCKFVHVNGKQYTCVLTNIEDCPHNVSVGNVCFLDKLKPIDYFYQVSVVQTTVEKSTILVEKIRKKYAKWLCPLQNGTCVDIVPIGVSKAQGLYRVMEYYDCTYDDVITVGDNINDLDMIREFHSYAMENGVEEVKKQADYIVSDVVEILEKEI